MLKVTQYRFVSLQFETDLIGALNSQGRNISDLSMNLVTIPKSCYASVFGTSALGISGSTLSSAGATILGATVPVGNPRVQVGNPSSQVGSLRAQPRSSRTQTGHCSSLSSQAQLPQRGQRHSVTASASAAGSGQNVSKRNTQVDPVLMFKRKLNYIISVVSQQNR